MPNQWTRRGLLGASLSGAALAASGTSAADPSTAPASTPQTVIEPLRETSVEDSLDVVVCGGGPAGISTAIAAARAGASVCLLEAHGCLGGVWTSGMLSYVMDSEKPGFNAELARRLILLDAHRSNGPKHYAYDIEAMKYVLEDLCAELKIRVQYHTRIVAVEKDAGNRVRGVITESKSGRQAWRGKTIVDTTGDGDVGALAGCEWEIGQEKDCPCQPMSLMGVITASPEVLKQFDTTIDKGNKIRFLKEIQRAGLDPSYAMPTLWHMGGSIAAVMLNHEYGVHAFDADAVTKATINARRELFHIAQGLRKLGGIWDGCGLVTTAEQIGVRDGRRIRGRYTVTVDDVLNGTRHEDAVCRSTMNVDVHAANREKNRTHAYSNQGVKAKPFDIPLRAMIASGVDGLMMAGRCISGDFLAHASYRVTGNAVAMGEAAGVTAALASRGNELPHEIRWASVAKGLQEIRQSNG